MEESYPDGYNDVLIEEEESMYTEDPATSTWAWDWAMLNPMIYINYALEFLASYGWFVLAGLVAGVYAASELRARYHKMRQQREDAEYHKDPDKFLSRMEAIQRAREAQQRRLEEESRRALQLQEEREAKKRQEALERLEKYGSAAGQRLGAGDDDYLPLSGGASSSSYRPPKRSKCGGGGCGK